MSATPVMSLVEHRVTVPREHEIIGLRELSKEEAKRIETAAGLITSVATSPRFRRLQGLSQMAASRVALVEARDQPTRQEIGSCRAAIHGLVQAHRDFTSNAAELIAAREVTEAVAQVEGALTSLGSSQTWKTLAELAEPGIGLAFDRDHNLGILTREEQFTAVSQLIDRAFGECEDAFMKALVAISQHVVEAARLLRSLHVECPQGVPALLDVSELKEAAGKESLSIVPRDLPLHLIYEALRLVRTAEKLSDERAETVIALRVDEDEAQHGSATAPRVQEAPTVEGPSVDVSELERAEPPPKQAVVDLPGLISAASELNDTLEAAWSGALNRALADDGIQEQVAAVRAAITGFQRRSEDDKVSIQEFPPGWGVIDQLEKDPQRLREQLACAQLVAFVDLLEKLQGITRPTTVQVRIRQEGAEELTKFWESGGFSRLRALLDLLRHLLEEPQPPDRERFPVEADRRFRLAHAAHHAGDPEGCLFHAACGLSWYLGLPVTDLEASLRDNDRAVAASAGLRALAAQLRGESALALSTLTAPALADLALELVMPFIAPRGMSGDELYDLIAQDVPHIPLDRE